MEGSTSGKSNGLTDGTDRCRRAKQVKREKKVRFGCHREAPWRRRRGVLTLNLMISNPNPTWCGEGEAVSVRN
jgi:hypothetical protein